MIPAIADQSDSTLWPLWFWALLAVLVIAAITLCVVLKIAAPAQETPATAPVPGTNPECARRGHFVARVGDSPVWICWRPLCAEVWFDQPEDQPFDQAKAEVVAEAEQLLRAGGAA